MSVSTARRIRRLPLLVPLNEFTYRFEVLMFTIQLVGRIFLFAVLWHAVYRPGEVAAGMTVEQAVAYSTLAAIIAGHSDVATIVDSFTERVREGTVAYLFIRPVSPIVYFLGLQAGGVAYRFVWLMVTGAIPEVMRRPSPLAPTAFGSGMYGRSRFDIGSVTASR